MEGEIKRMGRGEAKGEGERVRGERDEKRKKKGRRVGGDEGRDSEHNGRGAVRGGSDPRCFCAAERCWQRCDQTRKD